MDAGKKFGLNTHALTADDQGLIAMPKPLVAYVEQDHFVALIRADKEGVAYLCSDCGMWPGGRVSLTWKQWHSLNPGLYLALSKPGSLADGILSATLSAHPQRRNGVRVAYIGSLSGIKLSGAVLALPANSLRHIRPFLISGGGGAGNNPRSTAPHCLPFVSCPMAPSFFSCGAKGGPHVGDPVNLATGEEEYAPDPDLTVYNPHGPNVVWQRVYNSLRPGDGLYNAANFGTGWSYTYNERIIDAASTTQKMTQHPPVTFDYTTKLSSQYPSDPGIDPDATLPSGPNNPPSTPGTWQINNDASYDRSLIANSWANPNGWSVTFQGNSITVQPPAGANDSTTYKISFIPQPSSGLPTQACYFQIVSRQVTSYNLQAGAKYLMMPNGSRVAFSTPALPSSSQPVVHCTVAVGAPVTVDWDYDSAASAGHYIVTTGSRTKWVFTYPAVLSNSSGASSGDSLAYSLSQIIDRNGNSISFQYGASYRESLYSATLPSLTSITDDSTGVALLTVNPPGSPNNPISSITDVYGRSVYYSRGTYNNDQELSQVSQVVPAGTANPPMRWNYGYNAVGSFSGGFLTSISVPSPTGGSGTQTATLRYDPTTGGVTGLTDANGNTSSYTPVDASHVRTTITNAAGATVYTQVAGFDSNMNRTTVTDGTGAAIVSTSVYSDPNDPFRPSCITNGNGNQTLFSWDPYGNLLTETSPRGTLTTSNWDYSRFPLGEMTGVQEGMKSQATFDYYEPSGLVHDVSTPMPGTTGSAAIVTTTFVYDALGNVTTVTAPGNGTVGSITTTFNYTDDPGDNAHGVPALTGQVEALGQPLTVRDNLGKLTHLRYDVQGHLVTTYDALGNRTDANYVEPGQSVSLAGQLQGAAAPASGQTGSERASTQYAYLYPGGPLVGVTSYDESGNAIRQVVYSYGPEGETLAVSGSTEPVTDTYDALYRLNTLTDGGGHVTSYFYNAAGYLYQTVYPGAQATPPTAPLAAGHADTLTYPSYDADGNLLQRVDGNNVTTAYAYSDPESALTDVTYPAGTIGPVHYTFDAYGRCRTMADGTGSQTYAYGDDDELIGKSVTWTGLAAKTLTYGFNPDGSRQSMTADGHLFAYSYDGVGRMNGLAVDGANQASYAYQDNGWLQTKTLGSGDITTDTLDQQGRLLERSNTMAGGSPLSDFAIPRVGGYDGVGNRLSLTATIPGADPSYSGTTSYTYDYGQTASPQLNRSQLTRQTSTRATGTEVYNYDQTSFSGPGNSLGPGNATHYNPYDLSYNADNQISGNSYLSYDGNGNSTYYNNSTTNANGSQTLTYDPENRLTAYGTIQTDGWDGDGLRSWKQSSRGRTYFLYDGTTPVAEYDGAGTLTAQNVFGDDGLLSRFTPAGGRVFYSFDDQGSLAQWLSTGGTQTGTFVFDGFGTRTLGLFYTVDPWSFGAQAGYYTDTETWCCDAVLRPVPGAVPDARPAGVRGGRQPLYTQNNPVNEDDPDSFDRSGSLLVHGQGNYLIACVPMGQDINHIQNARVYYNSEGGLGDGADIDRT